MDLFLTAENAIKKSGRVALFTHIRPDGDAIGSTLALKYFLESVGKTVHMFCDSAVPKKFWILPDAQAFRTEISEEYDLAIAVDTANLDRLGVFSSVFPRFSKTICIDHHLSNKGFADINIVSADPSCSETMYKFLKSMGFEIDQKLAAYIFAGIVTDTGSFLQSNTKAETFAIAAELCATGLDFSTLGLAVFRMQSKNKFLLERKGLASLRFFEGDSIALIHFTQKDLTDTNTTLADTEGMVNSVLYIEGVKAAIAMVEAKGGYKVSLRSRGDINVNSAAGTFGGGGHKNAAGCVINAPFEEVVERLVRAVSLEF